MQLVYDNGLYIAECSYSEMLGDTPAREVAKGVGFRWNPQTKQWGTPDSYRARRLLQYATPECRAHLEPEVAKQEATKVLSRTASLEVEIPCPLGRILRPYQKVGVIFASERPAVLIGDQMGLGKTPETLAMLNILPSVQRVLVVCPNSVKLNWRNEALRWLLPELGYHIEVITSKWTLAQVQALFDTPGRVMGIVNYQILHRFCTSIDFATAGRRKSQTLSFLGGRLIDQIVVDECHNIKGETRQARAVMGVTAARKTMLSGTPIPNRPIELWNILHYLDPITWNHRHAFGLRYCNAVDTAWGWDYSGASNLAELQDILRSKYMLRRLKSQVETEIPPKQRQVIELSADGHATLLRSEWHAYHEMYHGTKQGTIGLLALEAAVELAKAMDDEADYRQAIAALKEGRTAAFREMAKLREATALAKLDQVKDHIHACLESVQKVVVYFWHRSVGAELQKEFAPFNPAVIIGSTSDKQRQAAVERFQTDPACRVFLGSIPAAKEGITLTAASLMVIAEIDWVPSPMQQVEARIDRLTQTEPTLVQYLVFEHSLDATMLRTIIAKLEVIEAALDRDHKFSVEELDFIEGRVPVEEPPEKRPATAWTTRQQVEEAAIQIDPAEVVRVHRALQYLAGVCDFAHAKDGQGFNMVDARIGHQMALQSTLSPKQTVLGQKILLKYHKQLEGVLL